MDDPHRESALLRQIWRELNATCFGSALTEPTSIGWLDLSGEADLQEEYGYYFPSQNGIALSYRFGYAEDQNSELERLAADSTLSSEEKQAALLKFNAYDIVLRLVAHEMIHQAVHQGGESAASHGGAFLKHAEGVAAALKIPGPTPADADQWPSIQYFLALEVQAGYVKA